MKVIVAGSRTISDYSLVASVIGASGFFISELVGGGAKGVDKLGEAWARINSVPVKTFPAAWDDLTQPDAMIKTLADGRRYDANAGPRRNEQMAAYSDALIAIRGKGESSGTEDMISRAGKHGLKVFVHRIDVDNLDDVEDARRNNDPIMPHVPKEGLRP